MKKSVLILSAIALLFAGCAKEKFAEKTANGGEEVFSFTVGLNSDDTKAVADNDGNAACVNHWVMEVLDSDGERYNYQSEDGEKGVKTHTFNVRLVKGQVYDVLFWADTKGYYNSDTLTNVFIKKAGEVYRANLDSLDAFSAVVKNFSTTSAASQNVTLKRPFAQMNIIFTDLKDLYETIGNETEYLKFKPENLVVTAKLPTEFNVMTQKCGDASSISLKADSDYLDNYNEHGAKETIFMDYIFASADSKDIIDLAFSFESKGTSISHNLNAVPFQRNYRTNIMGEFMSSGATWTVTIDSVWTGEIDQQIVKSGSIAAANEALKAGKTNISIVNPEDYADPIVFPTESNGKEISINISGTTGKKISFKNAEGADGPANLYVSADSDELDINTPKSHVEVLTGTYSKVTASTSAATLVVKKEVSIAALDIKAGNAEIRGIVSKITKAQASVVTYRIETVAALKNLRDVINARNWAAGKIYLETDIDLNNEEWAPIKAYCHPLETYAIDMDGQGHTIKNLKVTGASGIDYIGFFDQAAGFTVKNLNFDGASLIYPAEAGEGARGGVLVGNVWGINADNVNVKNVTIKACQKLGSLIGYIEGDTNVANTVKNCSAENVSISSNDPNNILQHGSGGFIGHISQFQNPVTTISGCSVKNITIANYNTAAYSEDELQRVPHVFVGSVCQNYDGAETPTIASHSIVFENNSISGNNTVLPTCIYSSKYFGWAGNAEERPDWKGYVYVDGEKWQPDYAFECGGVKYATLEGALAVVAQSSDKTVRIVKAGQYTVESLNAANCTVEATVEGVVFNHTPGSHARITGDSNENVTVKNITWNVGTATYQYYSGTNLENCTVNGIICTRTAVSFKDCKFVNADDYNFWIYGTDATFEGCEFTCPGGTKGGALNLYHENGSVVKNVVVKNCEFTALAASDKYAALYIKPEMPFNVTITNSTANDNFCTGAISGSKLWNVKNNDNKTTTVTVDGKLVYANGTPISISTTAQL